MMNKRGSTGIANYMTQGGKGVKYLIVIGRIHMSYCDNEFFLKTFFFTPWHGSDKLGI